MQAVASAEDIALMNQESRKVFVSDPVLNYAIDIVESTRTSSDVRIGASPRALIAYVAAARALALIRGRDHVVPDDLRELAVPVLAHRLSLHT